MTISALRRGSIAASRVTAPVTVNVLTLPGTVGNYVTTPDSSAASVTGDIDIRVKLSAVDWTPAAGQYIVAKLTAASFSYGLALLTAGTLYLATSPNGTTIRNHISTAATGFTDGTIHWVRAARVAGTATFYTSNDTTNDASLVSWTQLGSTVFDTNDAILNGSQALRIGATSDDAGGRIVGNVYYAEVRSSGGAVIVSFDATAVTKLGTRNPTTVPVGGSGGGTWTVAGSAWDWTVL